MTATKPGSAMAPVPGISAIVVNDEGHPVGNGESGYLVIDKPWPAMLRTIFGDDERYKDTYWSRFAAQGYYFAGDGAKYDTDGALWLLGRVDDVMNVSGHRISTTEVESALVAHPAVAEAAVVGAADEMTGQGIVAFVILRGSAVDTGDALITELRNHVATEIGPIAKPKRILVVQELPKTRSGKIMRRLLRDIAENRAVGDVTTLQDSAVMSLISSGLADGQPRRNRPSDFLCSPPQPALTRSGRSALPPGTFAGHDWSVGHSSRSALVSTPAGIGDPKSCGSPDNDVY